MKLSIVIPVFNELESLPKLVIELKKVLQIFDSWEVIFVDDGSSDKSDKWLSELSQKEDNFYLIQFYRNYGKSAALSEGFKAASGQYVITLDADLQDDPKEIPAMYDMIINDNFDLISGWKKKRFDSVIFKNIPSKIFNFAARTTSGIKLNDFNCGLKAFKKDVIKSINVYGEMHRYIPILAKNEGYKKIGEKIVNHRPRKYGKTKFGPSRFLYGFLDLLTIWFISSFGKRPMHLFGSLGLILITTGFLFAAYLGYDKIILNPGGRLITERPEFYISLVTMIIGSQFFSMGFIGELMLKSINQKPQYTIHKQTNL